MASAKQIAWRKKFGQLYGKKKKSRGTTMARRKTSKAAPRRRRSSPARRYARKVTKGKFIPIVDGIHVAYVVDGFSGGNFHQAASQGIGILNNTGTVDGVILNIKEGVDYALNDPKTALIGGIKNGFVLWVPRKLAEFIGLPASKKVGKYRIQTR